MMPNTLIIEGPTRLVVFDGQFFLPYVQEAVDYIRQPGCVAAQTRR